MDNEPRRSSRFIRMRDRQAARADERAGGTSASASAAGDETAPAEVEAQERLADRFAEQLSRHWSSVRSEMRNERSEPTINAGQSDFRPARVPYGVDLAAAWGWRFLVIVAAGYLVVTAVGALMVVVLPLLIALFIAALVGPVVTLFGRSMPRGLAAITVVVGVIATVSLMLTFATQQIIDGANDLADKVVDGLDQIQTWLKDGPLNASDQQIEDAIAGLQDLVASGNSEIVSTVTEVGTIIGHVVAGVFIVLFASFFFLYDGARIWAWVVRLFPRAARERADSSGRVAWATLTQFTRATVLVALVDAIGISLVALVLGVPFVAAIGVLVFLTAFVPMVGATVSGAVAVLVALVDEGWVVALIMLGGVLVVQQIESHVLQPFLMGRFVSVHPLGVILAIAVGVIVAGIPGALIAVPLVATINAVVVHLSSDGGEPPDDEFPLGDEPGETKAASALPAQ